MPESTSDTLAYEGGIGQKYVKRQKRKRKVPGGGGGSVVVDFRLNRYTDKRSLIYKIRSLDQRYRCKNFREHLC